MVPSTDWPERKEPPEYSNPPKATHKQKSATKEQSEHVQQHHPNDRRKVCFLLSCRAITCCTNVSEYIDIYACIYTGRRTTSRP